ncbi:MAG TPA: TonB-dependent receptor [Bacteroidales bacterium]|nr:TonB-dependent receptor [Bacteroidales bacterium]
MINKTELCILPTKCIKYKLVLMMMASLLFIISPLVTYAVSSGANTTLQPITVSGTVIDADNVPLPGVYVVVEGTNTGVITDGNGKYSIEVSSQSASLVFSYVGYLSQTIAVAGNSVINVTMAEDVTAFEEVVVIGYGTQRKEAVTGSVASIKGDVVQEVPASNITQALQGRVSGMEMSQTSSKPGAEMQIRIRGTRSLTANNDPLVVLDGIPFAGKISDISTSDIKSIDILKDASATAIYGSRGANGVILITSNRGQKGQKAQVNYNGYYGMKKVFAKYPMMNGAEFIELRTAAGIYSNGEDEADDVNTDWQDLFYQTGSVMNHDLSITGGTEQGSYNFGIGYYNDEAVIPTQRYNRMSMHGSIDQEVGKYFRFGFTTNNNYSLAEGSNIGMYGVLSMSPIADPYNDDGSWKRTIRMPLDNQFLYTKDVLKDIEDEWLSENRTFGTYNNMYGEVKIPGIEGLKYRLNLGLNFRQTNDGNFTGEGINSNNPETESTASIDSTHNFNWAVENLLTFDRTFAQKHQVNIVALYSAEQTKYNRSNIAVKDIPASSFQYYNLGNAAGDITINPDNQDYQLSGLISWMGRAMYSYDDRYMLSVALRSDASSRLAPGHKWHTYPAISLGWNIANESFMQNIPVINMLKIRAGYGETSNQSINPYGTLGRLRTRPYNFGPSVYDVGYYVSELPNTNLGWEYSETWNYGLDFGVLNNRLSGTVEYYVTNTKDLLLSVGLPATSGVNSYMANIGETQNKGFELSLNGVILDNFNGLQWEAGVNLYANRNKLMKLASGQVEDKTNWWFVGHPIDVIYDYKKIGIWQQDDPYLNILEGPGGEVGMIKVLYTGEFNEDGTPARMIGADDRQIMALEPDFLGGFNTRLSYKGFDLAAIGVFKSGGILISSLYSSSGYLNMMTGRRGNVKVDYWTPENTDAKYPSPAAPLQGDNPKYGSTLGYFDASYLKIRTITLGYTVNQNLIHKTGITNLRLYVTVQNPFVLFSPYKKESGMDPETNSYANENAASPLPRELRRLLTLGANTPSTRNYLIGINLTF